MYIFMLFMHCVIHLLTICIKECTIRILWILPGSPNLATGVIQGDFTKSMAEAEERRASGPYSSLGLKKNPPGQFSSLPRTIVCLTCLRTGQSWYQCFYSGGEKQSKSIGYQLYIENAYLCIHVQVCIYESTYVWWFVYTYICVYLSLYLYLHLSIYLSLSLSLHLYTK